MGLVQYPKCICEVSSGGCLKLQAKGEGSENFCRCHVSATPKVIGLDMTDGQLDVARKHVAEYTKTLGYAAPNMEFKKGYIERIVESGVAKESVDLVISNCVVNLSPDKPAVLKGK